MPAATAPRTAPEPNPVAVVILYLIAVFVGAALAAPRFLATVHYLAADGNQTWHRLASQPFDRFVNRSLILLALVGLPVFLKALRIPSVSALGLRSKRGDWAAALHGLIWGFAALTLTAALAISCGARKWNLSQHSIYDISHHVRNTAFVALLVATIEEILFRGALFGALRRKYRFWSAAVISSAFYAIVHFFEQPSSAGPVEWFSGFVTLGQMFRGFTQWHSLFPGFLNLTLIGVILAMGFERTGSLLFSIGLHAGLIFWVKSVGFATNATVNGNAWMWGTEKLVDGWASGVILIAMLIVLNKTLPKRETNA
jgi:membrane protease YdiL (CAAX protease family)